MLMNVAEQLMTLKKAKIGQRKRKPGRMFIVIDPAKAEQLKKDFEARPVAPEAAETPY
jgi:nitrate reductase NapAB chaperone NapD